GPQRRRVEHPGNGRLVAGRGERGIERPAQVGERDSNRVRARGRDGEGPRLCVRRARGRDERERGERRYFKRWKSAMQLAPKRIATTTVSRVRLRSTMCVPPWDCGVYPIPPRPASRPEWRRISPTSAIERRT